MAKIQNGSLVLLLCLVAHCAFSSASPFPTTKEVDNAAREENPANVNVYLVRTKRFEDQRGSSSGYMYKTTGHDGPTSYVHFKTSYGPLKPSANAKTEQQVYSIPADLPPITKHLTKKEIDENDKYTNAAEVFEDNEGPTHMEYNSDDDSDDEDYEEDHGSSYEDASSSKHGSKGQSGYSNKENFAKGASGEHDEENSAGSHAASGGHKAASHEDAGHYAEGHAAGSSENGGSHSHAESHKKGSKTSGYHKIYRKDEYKKDHTFYDEKDVKGHFDSYGKGHKEHASAEGGFRKGGKHASAHKEGEQSEKGHFDKGRYNHQDAGYRAKDGGEKYYQNRADYKGADGKHSYREQAY